MKKSYPIFTIIFLLATVGCQPTPPPLDSLSIQNTTVAIGNTAIAMAWTSVSQTQNAPTPQPTHAAATIPTKSSSSPENNFEMSWDIYSSEFNSLGGILTIRKQDTKYTQTLLMSDGSGDTGSLSVKVVNGETRLHDDRFDDYYGDYMLIEKNGYLSFYDNQGLIYSVPPLK